VVLRTAGPEVLFLNVGPLEADLAQKEVLPYNEILLLHCQQGGGVSGGAKQEDLVGGEGSHKTGGDGRVGLY